LRIAAVRQPDLEQARNDGNAALRDIRGEKVGLPRADVTQVRAPSSRTSPTARSTPAWSSLRPDWLWSATSTPTARARRPSPSPMTCRREPARRSAQACPTCSWSMAARNSSANALMVVAEAGRPPEQRQAETRRRLVLIGVRAPAAPARRPAADWAVEPG